MLEDKSNPLVVSEMHLRTAWIKIRNTVLDTIATLPESKWFTALIPLTNSIASRVVMILILAKWEPCAFNVWHDPRGDEFIFTAGFSSFIDSVLQELHSQFFQEAAQHYSSTGIERGVNWKKSMALHSYFVYAGADSSSLGALEYFLAGAMFPKSAN